MASADFTFTVTQREFEIIWNLLGQGPSNATRILMNKLEAVAGEQITAYEQEQASLQKVRDEQEAAAAETRLVALLEAKAAAAQPKPIPGFINPDKIPVPTAVKETLNG